MCGIVGGYTVNLVEMLSRIQHRGFAQCGIVTGFTRLLANRVNELEKINDFGIGHVRYVTNEDSVCQPYFYKSTWTAFNGEVKDGDTVKLAKTLFHGGRIAGAYSFVWKDGNQMMAGRDPFGFHPLYVAWSDWGYAVASETTADPKLNWTEVDPGTIVNLANGNVYRFYYSSSHKCCFEDVYFSHVTNKGTWARRRELGQLINVPKADIIVPVPDSAIAAAEALSEKTGIPCVSAIVRNRGTDRTFITENGQENKYTLIPEALWDKCVILVDDSIVRGPTMQYLVPQIKRYAKEVHVRVTFPKIKYKCRYGIHIESEGCHEIPEADSLEFLNVEHFTGCRDCVIKDEIDFDFEFSIPSMFDCLKETRND